MLPMRDETLAAYFTADRLAAAERQRLLRVAIGAFDRSLQGPEVPPARRLLTRTGHLLVRFGHWWEPRTLKCELCAVNTYQRA